MFDVNVYIRRDVCYARERCPRRPHRRGHVRCSYSFIVTCTRRHLRKLFKTEFNPAIAGARQYGIPARFLRMALQEVSLHS
jgi:hypothetical protein